MKTFDAGKLAWQKSGGLLPAVVQDARDGAVLMLGWMNREAFEQTRSTGKATFFSRSKQRLWEKGESSGNTLYVNELYTDCDADSILVLATPQGPTCHAGTRSCFGEPMLPALSFLARLDALVAERERIRPAGSYTTRLFESGTRRIAQKLGEEGVETALAASGGNDAELLDESADLLFHLIVLLRARGKSLSDVAERLRARHAAAA